MEERRVLLSACSSWLWDADLPHIGLPHSPSPTFYHAPASLLPPPPCSAVRHKSHKEIAGEIQAVIRQITASVTFLPLLEEPCSFDLLVYADTEATVPGEWRERRAEWLGPCSDGILSYPRLPPVLLSLSAVAWEESDPRYISESSEVRLRSFTTSIHKVAPTVSYRVSGHDV